MPVYAGGQNTCGVSIGVLCLDSYFPKPPGHIRNPSGLDFTVLYETIPGTSVPELINDPEPEFVEPFIKAAQRLEREGVRAITGSCGFLALYQRQLADAVDVPVFASSLIQVPLAYQLGGCKAPVGILTASKNNLSKRHLSAVGAGHIPVVIQGMEGQPEFTEVILENRRTRMDTDKIETEVLDAARQLMRNHPDTRVIVLECTDLPPYAHRLQEELKIPIMDLTTLTTMVHDIVMRRPYPGFMPN